MQRGGRQGGRTNHSPATVILPVSSSQPYLFNAAAIPPRLQPAHFHGCFQQTQALPPLLLSNQGLLADFSPIRKRLKGEDPYRLSFQAGHTSEFSAVTGFMINKHATLSTKVSGRCDTVLKFRTRGFMFEKKGHWIQRNTGDLDQVVVFVLVGFFPAFWKRLNIMMIFLALQLWADRFHNAHRSNATLHICIQTGNLVKKPGFVCCMLPEERFKANLAPDIFL